MESEINNPKSEIKNNVAGKMRMLDKYNFLKIEYLISNIPYFIFIVMLCIFYIWNNHNGVKMVKQMRDTEDKMIEVQWYYNATKDELTRNSRQSAVAEKVQVQNMYELSNPPYTIIEN